MVRVLHPLPLERLKLLVFDLDGTLIDSAQDLCNSVNAALAHVGYSPLPDPVIAGFVGNGVPMLVRRSLAYKNGGNIDQLDETLIARTQAFFLDYYREHKLDFTYAYEGVLESLKALRELHDSPGGNPRIMAVLTNKPVRPSRGICEGLGLADYFLHIYGGDSFQTKKPDPLGLRTLINEAGALPEETVMIGDSKVDVQDRAQCRRVVDWLRLRIRPAKPDGNPAGCAGRFARGVDRRAHLRIVPFPPH